jgi:hypothetical protein
MKIHAICMNGQYDIYIVYNQLITMQLLTLENIISVACRGQKSIFKTRCNILLFFVYLM